MKLKPLLITVCVLGALVGATIFLNKSKKTGLDHADDPYLGKNALTSEDIEALQEIFILADGETTVLEKKGDTWTVPGKYGLPANFNTLENLVKGFTDAEIVRKVTTNTEVMKRFDLDSTTVVFKKGPTDVIREFNIGKTNDSGGRFVRFGGQGPVYLFTFNGFITGRLESWPSKYIESYDTDDVTKIEVELEDGSFFAATREEKHSPFVAEGLAENEILTENVFDDLISSFSSIYVNEIHSLDHPDAQAARENDRTIRMTLGEDSVITIKLGRRPAPTTADKVVEGIDKAIKGELDVEAEAAEAANEEKEEPKPGPVYFFVESTDADTQAKLQMHMAKASFLVGDFFYDKLPSTREDLIAVETPSEETEATSEEAQTETAAE